MHKIDDTKTPAHEALHAELEAIRAASGFTTAEQLSQWFADPQLSNELRCSERNRPHTYGGLNTHGGLTVAEEDLCAWLDRGRVPDPFIGSDAESLVDWTDPKDGIGGLEAVNATRVAWFLSHQRLRARLAQFLALPLSLPREITQEDVEQARRELGIAV